MERKVGIAMNGINYSALMGNGLYTNNSLTEEVKYKGSVTGGTKKTAGKSTDKQTGMDKDTFEYSGTTREVKAGYDRPKRVAAKKEQEYKPLDSDGIQEGVELSDAAKNLLKELREKYKNMDIYAAEWSSDEEQAYYAGFSNKEYSVLINPEALEAMAADPAVREKYESVLGGVEGNFNSIKEALGEDADKVSGFSVTIDKDGKVSYALNLLKSIGEDNENNAKKLQEKREQDKIEQKRAEKKEEQKERLEKLNENKEYEKIEADSIEELIAAVKSKLYPETEKISISETAEQSEEVLA